MRLTEIKDRQLDSLVEQAISVNTRGDKKWPRFINFLRLTKFAQWNIPKYSTSWKHAGKIIQEYEISVEKFTHKFQAAIKTNQGVLIICGDTYLEAAMRAYVLKTFGMWFSSDYWFSQPPFQVNQHLVKNFSVTVSAAMFAIRYWIDSEYMFASLWGVLFILAFYCVNRNTSKIIFEGRNRLNLASMDAQSTLSQFKK